MIGDGNVNLKVKLADLIDGTEIVKDVMKDGAILAKEGTVVDKRIKEFLKKWNINEVEIKHSKYEKTSGELTNKKELLNLCHKQFKETLPFIADEIRYGFALHDDNDYLEVESLFIKLMSNPLVFKKINELKEWDHYSYLHSIDTFILGTLFAMNMKLKNIETFALACLIHDVGKLEISRELLQKKGMLTTREFAEIQKHVNFGYEWLKFNNFDGIVCELARSHHERRDGSGYPNQLTGLETSSEVDMLMIIDVYSALTLPRSYHKGRSSIAAISVLVKEGQKFNNLLLYRFLEMLKIFPPTSTVTLSDNKMAKILYVNDRQPYLPLVQLIETEETLQLPINYSTHIKKLIRLGNEDEKKQGTLWEDYLSALLSGEKHTAIHLFDKLIDNRRIEDIYINVIGKSMHEVGQKWTKGSVTIAEEHVAAFITREILDYFKYRSIPIANEVRPKIACVTVEGDPHTLPLKIAVDILEAKGWKVYNLEFPLPVKDLIKFLEDHSIDKLGISITLNEAIPNLNHLISEIKKVAEKITVIVGGGASDNKEIIGADIIVTKLENFDNYFSND